MFRNEHLSRNLPKGYPRTPIWLHVHSGGGDLFAGLSMADQLRQIDTPIYSIVEGYCASAATLISMSCSKRFIQPSAFVLIHQLSAISWGTYEQLRDDMHMYDMAMEKLVEFYKQNTKLKRKQIKEMLKRDSWFQASECLQHGLADELLAS
jgi:ATP-dependent protease ClpP protease subunit